jgi:hypothetical protein
MPRQGWAKRQIANTERNIRQWPAWMRREAGIETSEDRQGQRVQKTEKPKEKGDR